MMFIYKITEVKFRAPLCEDYDVIFDENDTASYTPCKGPYR